MNYIINLFGTGIRYWNCELDQTVFDDMNRIRMKNQVEWEQVLFDLNFLYHYGFAHWSELSKSPAQPGTEDAQRGFLLDPQNRIEIKQGGKLLSRFRANELNTAATLFPLYSTSYREEEHVVTPTKTSFQLIQFEKGLIGKFKFEAEHFSIDQLHYVLSRIGNNTFLSNIQLSEQFLESSQEDCVVVGSFFLRT